MQGSPLRAAARLSKRDGTGTPTPTPSSLDGNGAPAGQFEAGRVSTHFRPRPSCTAFPAPPGGTSPGVLIVRLAE
jgi:hypothetical protein